MSMVTSLKTTCSRENVVRLFAKFANKYGSLWTTRLGINPDWEMCIDDWHEDLKKYEYKALVLAARSALVNFNDFPPTFGQFEDLCKKHSGFIQLNDAIRLMMDRDFSHPIVKMMYDKIGSWTLTNGKEADVHAQAKEAYKEAEYNFILYPKQSWEALESFNSKPKALPEPEKIPTLQERKSFKEMLSAYQKKVEELKLNVAGNPYKEFDENKLKVGGREYDETIYNEYRTYLISIPEKETMILPIKYLYDRNRFLSKQEVAELLHKSGYNPDVQRTTQQENRRNNKPTSMYKNWRGGEDDT